MTHIEQMIQDMCPNGVEFKTLGEVEKSGLISMGRGNVISKDDMKNTPGDYPVYSSSSVGNGEIGRYGLYMFDDERITWSIDGGGKFFYRNNHKYSVTNVGGWIKVLREDIITTKFLYYILIKEWTNKVYDYNHKAHPSVIREEYEIPLPPIEIQKKIVECLDKFSALAAELQAELQMRRKQYEYYRTQLLTPHSDCNSADKSDDAQWEWKTLGEIGTFTRGRRFVRTDIVEEGQPCIHYGDMYTYYGLATDHARTHLPKDFPVKLRYAEKGDVIIVGAGENDMDIGVGCVWEGNEPVAVHDACYIFKHNQNPRYISHYLRTLDYHLQIKKSVSTAKICAISPDGIAKAKIAIPSLAEQARIVSILDKFEALTTSLSDGIPAEQAAQQKRYEYYRDLLLTFDRKAV